MDNNKQSDDQPPPLRNLLGDPVTNAIIGIIGLLVVIIGPPTIYSLIQNRNSNLPTTTDTPSPTTMPLPANTQNDPIQLKHSYSGTAHSTNLNSYTDGSITFTVTSQDQQGNIKMETTFQQIGGSSKFDNYSCEGSTQDNKLNLNCLSESDQTYILHIEGSIYPDHIEGAEEATNTENSDYNNIYKWEAF